MIKNIIFDFGDVFINLDKPATKKAFADLGITEISKELQTLLDSYESGGVSTLAFLNFFKENYGAENSDIIKAWVSILKDFPQKRLNFLKELKASGKYRLFLLSNTNEMHINFLEENLDKTFFTEFKNCFEQFYLSYKINLIKPDKTIYEFVLNENNLKASETLFIDDLAANTASAKTLGINVWNLKPGVEDVTQLFDKYPEFS